MKGKRSNKQSFTDIYTENCFRYGTCPQKYIKNLADDGIVNVRADRLKTEDWQPLLETLQKYEDIKYLAVRNKSECESKETNGKLKNLVNKTEISNKFCQILKKHLQSSTNFECLILEKLKLSEENVKTLSEGFSVNSSLRYISFERCHLGNKHFQLICQSLKNSSSLSAVDFSDCNLTWKIADVVTNLIEQQTLVRYGNIWQNSLRYQMCHLEKMGGLTAINLSNNPAFGDKGFAVLTNGLTENTCLKELYLRHCGLTDESAVALLKFFIDDISVDVDDNSFQAEILYEKIYEKCSKPSLEKLEKRFMPQITLQHFDKSKPIPFKTGLPNQKIGIEMRHTSVKIRAKTVVSEDFNESNRKLKERLVVCETELETEKSEHSKTKIALQKLTLEAKEKPLLEDNVLTAIEETFKKFQQFMNLLKTSELENFVKVPRVPEEFLRGDFNLRTNKPDDRHWISVSKRISTENSD